MKLTSKNITSQKLVVGKHEQIIFDEEVPGFGLRLRKGGFRGLIFQYKTGSLTRRIAMGSVDAIDIVKAREDAKDYYARVRLGQDPAADMRDAKVKRSETFKAAAKLFLARQRTVLRPRSYVDVERHINVLAEPLHGIELAKIERRHIATLLGNVEQKKKSGPSETGGLIAANRLRASLSKMFTWAIGSGLAETNPVTGTNRNKEISRDRVLSPAELRIIWRALPKNDYGTVTKLLMLTGQRAGEIADLRWHEVGEAEIKLPAERTKNHRPHTVPLAPSAVEILAAVLRRTRLDGALRELVFGAGEGGFSGWSKAKEQLDERIVKMTGEPIQPWRIHDLRRSFATHAAEELGIQPHIIEAILNHVSGYKSGVAGTYNRSTYEVEKRIALVRWADQVTAWIEDRKSNVTALRA